MSKLDMISLGLVLFAVITIVLGIIKVHTYPGKIAQERNHPQTDAIEVTSLLGLIIFPFWMFALMWAYSDAVIGTLYTKDTAAEGAGTDAPDNVAGSGVADANTTTNAQA